MHWCQPRTMRYVCILHFSFTTSMHIFTLATLIGPAVFVDPFILSWWFMISVCVGEGYSECRKSTAWAKAHCCKTGDWTTSGGEGMNENQFHAQFPWNDQINCTIFGAMRNKCCFGGLWATKSFYSTITSVYTSADCVWYNAWHIMCWLYFCRLH